MEIKIPFEQFNTFPSFLLRKFGFYIRFVHSYKDFYYHSHQQGYFSFLVATERNLDDDCDNRRNINKNGK